MFVWFLINHCKFFFLLQAHNIQHLAELDDDPLSSVISDLTKLTSDATITIKETVASSIQRNSVNTEENVVDGIGSPDSLDVCNMDTRPIPPPRTRVPVSLATNGNTIATSSTLQNPYPAKQITSVSDHDLLLSLASSGNKFDFTF